MARQQELPLEHDFEAMTDDEIRQAWMAAVAHEQRRTRGDRLLAVVRVARDHADLHRAYRQRLADPR
jgi:hypothetical protein